MIISHDDLVPQQAYYYAFLPLDETFCSRHNSRVLEGDHTNI